MKVRITMFPETPNINAKTVLEFDGKYARPVCRSYDVDFPAYALIAELIEKVDALERLVNENSDSREVKK